MLQRESSCLARSETADWRANVATMVTATRTEQKMVTGIINGQEVTVPAGTVILEAARMAGIEIPNLCFQPLLRAWGSCRICTVPVDARLPSHKTVFSAN